MTFTRWIRSVNLFKRYEMRHTYTLAYARIKKKKLEGENLQIRIFKEILKNFNLSHCVLFPKSVISFFLLLL